MARDRSFNMDPIKISFGGGRASRKASNLGAVIFGCRILGNCSTNAFDATKAIFLIVHNNLSLNPFRLAGRRRRHRKEQSEWPVENESTERPRLFDAARKRAELTGIASEPGRSANGVWTNFLRLFRTHFFVLKPSVCLWDFSTEASLSDFNATTKSRQSS